MRTPRLFPALHLSNAVLVLALVGCAEEPAGKPADDTAPVATETCPVASIDKTELTWTDVVAGTSETGTLALANACTGEVALDVAATQSGSGAFTVDASAWSVLPGEIATITVTFAPTGSEEETGYLLLTTNDPDRPEIGVTLTGAGDDDADGDGVGADEDCDDTDANSYPGAPETWYDGIDQACDGGSDFDRDGDGFDSDAFGGEDCEDGDATAYPGGTDAWYDGVDGDCAGDDDYDADLDGYRDPSGGGDDCDDTDAAVYPGAPDVVYDGVDADCSGSDYDADGDGSDAAEWGGDDCDDMDATIHPGATEAWYDGVDADCAGDDDYDQDADGLQASDYGGLDCDDTDAVVYPGAADAWYDGVDADCAGDSDYDADLDGYDAYAYGGSDCDDGDAAVRPGVSDTWYDGVDTDCDGWSDYDADGDGADSDAYGGDDCDDTRADVHVGASEVWYDGVDGDCDGAGDFDQDGDGEDAFTWGGEDCDDTDATTLDGPAESRNGLDDDCDGYVDEGEAAAGDVVITEVMVNPDAVSDTAGEWFEVYVAGPYDVDLNGWIVYADDGSRFTIGESVPVGAGEYALLGVDDDPATNGGVTLAYTYARVDFALADTGDSIYLVSGSTTVAELSFDASWADADGYAFQLDADHTDGTDAADEAYWCVATSTFGSGDHGTPGAANDQCDLDEDGDGWSPPDGDCDDADVGAYPGATESPNGLDDDCDGVVDEGTSDDDGDGWSEVEGDCDDADGAVSPGAAESCNSVDDDCDGDIDPEDASGCTAYYYDYDGDGYGSSVVGSACLCEADGYYDTTVTDDCYDYNASASPAATSYATTQRGDGSYDWDCDGSATKYYTSTGSCSGWPFCGGSDGWDGSVPSCGASGSWIYDCTTDWTGCDEHTVSLTQACR